MGIARDMEIDSKSPRFVRALQAFFATQSAGGVVLLVATVAALALANSPWASQYHALWEAKLTVGIGSVGISKDVLHWINDGLMAIFFFVVGLEIKREVLVGELSSPRGAALPLMGAVGGMVVPALIYVGVVSMMGAQSGTMRGWAVPMATDIAFALGVLALLGRRAPLGLKVFLTALAIADDLGAVLVIAIFYTSQVSVAALAAAGVIFAALIVANAMGVRRTLVYGLLGVAMWVAVLKSGVHATIAGVMVAMAIPARRRIDAEGFLERATAILGRFGRDVQEGEPNEEPTDEQREAVYELEEVCEHVTEPLRHMEHALHPWVAFAIMPVFAFANAGVTLGGGIAHTVVDPVAVAVFLGLFVGKQVGVFSFAWLAIKIGVARMPGGVTWGQLFGVSVLCGIGFTMSLFIAGLAYPTAEMLDASKVGILGASVASAVVGAGILLWKRGGRSGELGA